MDVSLTWEKGEDVKDFKHVELMIVPANAISNDPFTREDEDSSDLKKYMMTCSDSNNVYVRKLCLSIGFYHYVFKVTTKSKTWVTTGNSKYKTVLASGRNVNYVEVGAMSPRSNRSFSDCLPGVVSDENSLLLSAATKKERKNNIQKKTNKPSRSNKICCCSSSVE